MRFGPVARFATPAVVVSLMICVAPSVAQSVGSDVDATPPFVTDRPTVSFAPVVVPPGLFQLEMGTVFSRVGSGSGATERLAVPDLLARFGVTGTVELRLIAAGWRVEDSDEGRTDGLSDVALSTKIVLSEGRSGRPATGLIFDLSLPLGSSEFSSGHVIPRGLFLVSTSLGRGVDLVANTGATLVIEDVGDRTERSADLSYSAVVSGSVGGGVGLFGELYGVFPTTSRRDEAHDVQAGVTALVSRRVQLDLRVGAGLWEEGSDWLVGAGVAFRVPR